MQAELRWREHIQQTIAESKLSIAYLGAKLNSWHIGGVLDCLIDVESRRDLLNTFALIHTYRLPWRIVGRGSNVLIPDQGLRGITLRLGRAFAQIEATESKPVRLPPMGSSTQIWAGAAASNAALVKFCEDRGWGGVEFLGVIPGSIGGAVANNAGAHGRETVTRISRVQYFDCSWASTDSSPPAELETLIYTEDTDRQNFGYRLSPYGGKKGSIILKALWEVSAAPPQHIKAKRQALIQWRRQHQPHQYPNCGSIFKNPGDDFAARLIEAAGCKGKRHGDAQVSTEHANFIVNLGQASARDVTELVATVHAAVLESSGIALELEMEMLSAHAYPQDEPFMVG